MTIKSNKRLAILKALKGQIKPVSSKKLSENAVLNTSIELLADGVKASKAEV